MLGVIINLDPFAGAIRAVFNRKKVNIATWWLTATCYVNITSAIKLKGGDSVSAILRAVIYSDPLLYTI